jgi:hypothetical protein
MFGVILDAVHVFEGLAVISMTSDATVDVTRRKMVIEIARRVLVDLLILITMMIMVVVMMTSTTFLSALIVAAVTPTCGIGWGRIIVMLVTWTF